MINLIIGYNDNNYTITGFNGTLEQAKEYYINNLFNIEEKTVRAVSCELYSKFKVNVYEYCMEHDFLIAKFNDNKEELTLVTNSLGVVTQNYLEMKKCIDMYSGSTLENFIKVLNKENLNDHQSLSDFITSMKLYKEELKHGETDKNYVNWLREHVTAMMLEGV